MSANYPYLAPAAPALSQRGAGAIGFTIVALPVLLAGLGSVELSHWFYTRQAISAALLDAGRAGITHHNRSAQIIATFEQSLKPLYTSSNAPATSARLAGALIQRQNALNGAPWQIEFLSPSATAYTDFSDPNLQINGATGKVAINNHYLAEQDAQYRALGWPDGRGPASGQTIYEANTAVLRLTWLHRPRLPLLVPILRALGDSRGSYRKRAFARGYLPMVRQVTLLMQSHPVQWADDPSGKVLYRPKSHIPTQGCMGWLCNAGTNANVTIGSALKTDNNTNLPSYPGTPPSGVNDDVTVPGSNVNGATDPNDPHSVHPDLEISLDDPACGITLCCL